MEAGRSAASAFQWKNDPGRALAIYGRLQADYPEDLRQMNIQAAVAKAYLEMGAVEQANRAADELLAKYAEHKDFAKAVNELGKAFRKNKQYAKALELQKFVLSMELSPEQMLAAMAELTAGLIFYQDFAQASAAEEVLLRDCAGQKGLASALNAIAQAWEQVGQYDKALDLYAYVRQSARGTRDETTACVGTAVCYYKLGQDDWVLAEVDGIVADANALPAADWAVFAIGEEYYFDAHTDRKSCDTLTETGKELLPKAIAVWSRIIDNMPDSVHTPEAWYFTGASYGKLEDFEGMTGCYRAVVDGWPQFKFNWSAQPLIGWGYEMLKHRGVMSAEEADPLIEDAYLTTIGRYPKGCFADQALKGLLKIYGIYEK